jgi:hypothetical protein
VGANSDTSGRRKAYEQKRSRTERGVRIIASKKSILGKPKY